MNKIKVNVAVNIELELEGKDDTNIDETYTEKGELNMLVAQPIRRIIDRADENICYSIIDNLYDNGIKNINVKFKDLESYVESVREIY